MTQTSQTPSQVKKILMIAYVFPPIAYAGTYRTLRFCRYLPENGWLPIILTIKRGDDLNNDDSLLQKISSDIQVHRTKIVDFWRWQQRRKVDDKAVDTMTKNEGTKSSQPNSETIRKQSLLSRFKTYLTELLTTPDHMIFWVPFAVTRGFFLLLRNDIKVIYTSSPPHSEHIAGYILSKLFRKPWVADFRDPMLDSSGYSPSTPYRRWIDKILEKLIVRNADQVLIISNHYKKIMEHRYPQAAPKFIMFPNGYDPEDFQDIKPHFFDKFTIVYAGSFYANRKPDFFLRSFGSWYHKQPPEVQSKTQIIFYGIMPSEVIKMVQEQDLDDVILTPGIIPKDQLLPSLKGADVLLLIIGFDRESRGTITSKIFEYMACQRPILGIVPEGDAADILQQYNQAFIVTSEDCHAVEKYLTRTYSDFISNKHQKISNQNLQPMNNNHGGYDARNQSAYLTRIFNNILSTK